MHDRQQYIRIGSEMSGMCQSTHGVPQGSILGPALFKDGAYYCYCAYVLRICRYSDFLSVVLTNAGIFLSGLNLCGESRI